MATWRNTNIVALVKPAARANVASDPLAVAACPVGNSDVILSLVDAVAETSNVHPTVARSDGVGHVAVTCRPVVPPDPLFHTIEVVSDGGIVSIRATTKARASNVDSLVVSPYSLTYDVTEEV